MLSPAGLGILRLCLVLVYRSSAKVDLSANLSTLP